MNRIIKVGAIDANLSPDAFHMLAAHLYRCSRDFKNPDKFSLLPYFLLCRAIELGVKSIHLRDKKQREVKNIYRHSISVAYEALKNELKTLNDSEVRTLKTASDMYREKRFEYPHMDDCLEAYSDFPDLNTLDAIAAKVLSMWDQKA